jgi:hypothetical protein
MSGSHKVSCLFVVDPFAWGFAWTFEGLLSQLTMDLDPKQLCKLHLATANIHHSKLETPEPL